MALPKRVKIGGAYYAGHSLAVLAAAGDYVLDMTISVAGAANALTVIPSVFGEGDTFSLLHVDSAGETKATIGESIPNVGAYAAWRFDFPAMQKMAANDSFRLTYTNAAGKAMTVWTCIERIR